MREFVTILRRLLDGENVTFSGEIFSVRNFQLQMQLPPERAKIYIAANGPRMIRLAGEIADGMLGYFHSLAYVENVVLPNLRIGAERSGRNLAEIEATVGFPSVVTTDDSGVHQAKGQVMMFATALDSAPAYMDSIVAAGFGHVAEEIQSRVAAGDTRGAAELVSDEMADALTISGSPDNVRRRISEYEAAGITGVMLNPSVPGGWFPLYEGHFPPGAEIPEFDFHGLVRTIDNTVALLGS